MSEENAWLQREAQKKKKVTLYFQGQVEALSIIGDDSQDQGAQDRAQGEDGVWYEGK